MGGRSAERLSSFISSSRCNELVRRAQFQCEYESRTQDSLDLLSAYRKFERLFLAEQSIPHSPGVVQKPGRGLLIVREAHCSLPDAVITKVKVVQKCDQSKHVQGPQLLLNWRTMDRWSFLDTHFPLYLTPPTRLYIS